MLAMVSPSTLYLTPKPPSSPPSPKRKPLPSMPSQALRMPSKFLLVGMLGIGIIASHISPVQADPFTDSLQHALDSSDSLRAQVEAIQSAREGLRTARASQEWTTRLTASDTRARIDTNRRQDIIDDSNSVSVIITKPLYDGGLGRANFNVAELQLDSAVHSYQAGEQGVLLAASQAYVDVAAGRLRLEVAEANVGRLRQHEAASRLRVEVGESTPTQLALAQSRLARAEASQISAANDLTNAIARYEVIFARPPARNISLPDLATIVPKFASINSISPTHPTHLTSPTHPTHPTSPTSPTHPTPLTSPPSPTPPTPLTSPTHPTHLTSPTSPTSSISSTPITRLASLDETIIVHPTQRGTPDTLDTLDTRDTPVPVLTITEAVANALVNHPDHKIAVIAEQLALRGLDALAAQVRPTIDLNLMATSTDTYQADQQSERISAQLTFSTPILPRSSVRAAGRQAVANHRGSASR
ncbi:MAG: TolC family protein, partial [Proteobacteria bacterium]|nr:TolC family protein [Pseudomonadota bacterium]